ncbi:MAG TPA: FG-GAP and VCBS repeat-containing protein [Planctomycetota bacterium]|nr:FG-GAP and VCBS repeat-containing protein [Planctomycetota bacterium]
MDIDGDGDTDLLSGSYQHDANDASTYLYVFTREPGGNFAAPRPVLGTDGRPLRVTTRDRDDVSSDVICLRPAAADLDGDGKIDLVVGTWIGTFAFFRGAGNGVFEPTTHWLECEGSPLRVDGHGDPCLVDWDGDGDLDLVSGSDKGGVFLFVNRGSKKAPRWAKARTLWPAWKERFPVLWGDDDLEGPGPGTRVAVADVDGDGKLDLLVGDDVRVLYPAADVELAAAKKRFAAWQQKEAKHWRRAENARTDEESRRDDAAYDALLAERATFAREESTGFVWLLRQK